MQILRLAKYFKSKKILLNGNIVSKKNGCFLTYFSQFNYSKQQKFSDIMEEVESGRQLLEYSESQKEYILTTQDIVTCLQSYDYDSNFDQKDQKENFRVLFNEVVRMFEYYFSLYPFFPQIVRLDDTTLEPLIDQDYVELVEKYSYEEYEKKFYSTKLKAIGFLCEIMQSEIDPISIERMHELMNEYLDQYELQIIYSRQYEELVQIEINLKRQMELSNFYFLVARIVLEQNQIDEFERFILMGLEETKNSYDYLLKHQKNQENDVQDQIIGSLNSYPPKLLTLFYIFQALINLDSSKQFLINYLNEVKRLSDLNQCINEETFQWKLQLAIEFYALEQYEQAFNILKFIYDERHVIEDKQIMSCLLQFFSRCLAQTNNEDYNLHKVLKEMTNLDNLDQSFVIVLLIQQEIQQFNILIENKQFQSLQDQIEKILTLFDQYCDFIQLNKSDALFDMFEFIDSLMSKKYIPNKQLHLSQLYLSLRKLKNCKLTLDKQEFEKYFYLIILYFYHCQHKKKEPLDLINQVQNYFSKYECDSKYRKDLFNKVQTLNQILSSNNYKDLQLQFIELMIQKLKQLSLDQSHKELLQQFQLKKQQLEIDLKRKK